MKRQNHRFLIFVLALFGLSLLHLVAKAQLFSLSTCFRLSGQVVSADSLLPLDGVNILNLNLKTGTATALSGFFEIQVSTGDTLIFSHIGYQRDTLIVPLFPQTDNPRIKILLKPRLYELKQAIFYGNDNPLVFRQKFISLDIPDTSGDTLTRIPGLAKGAFVQNPAGGIVITGPFTVLYNQLSKKAREIRKVQELVEEDERQKLIDAKYNREYIAKLTGLEGEQLTAFMDFCEMKKEFIISGQQIDIANHILDCYGHFQQQAVPQN